ncbi:hypothetical protein HPB47_005671, partial [Ixodes persulcatus]
DRVQASVASTVQYSVLPLTLPTTPTQVPGGNGERRRRLRRWAPSRWPMPMRSETGRIYR